MASMLGPQKINKGASCSTASGEGCSCKSHTQPGGKGCGSRTAPAAAQPSLPHPFSGCCAPVGVLNAGSRRSPRSTALAASAASPLRSAAAARPPRMRITVSKKLMVVLRSKSSFSITQLRPLRGEGKHGGV